MRSSLYRFVLSASVPCLAAVALLLTLGTPGPTVQAGLDLGVIEISSTQPVPHAWAYVDDGTIDGNGTEYFIFTTGYVHPSPLAPAVTETYTYQHGVNPGTLGACLQWIVDTYPHVTSTADLSVHLRTVSVVQ